MDPAIPTIVERMRIMHERVGFDRKGHKYQVDGQSLDSVTTIIGNSLAKGPGFMGWIAKVTREGKDWRKVGREEADKGTAVHYEVERWARRKIGLAPPAPIEVSPEASYLASGLPDLLDSAGIIPLYQPEVRLFHLPLGYAGTLDLPCMWEGQKTVIDIKTCRKGDDCWDDWPLQNAAYRGALEENGCGVWLGAILRVPKDGSKPNLLPLGHAPHDFQAFRDLLGVYRWQKQRTA